MKHKYFLLLSIIFFLAGKVSAQSTISLSEAINSSFANRKNIQAGKIDVQIQQLITKSLYKKYGPQVSAEYNYTYNPILQSSIIPVGVFNPALAADATQRIQFGTNWSQSAGITAVQPLFDGTIKKQIDENKLQEKIIKASQAQTEYDLAYEVSKAYINIYLQQQKINSAIIDTTRTALSYKLELDNFNAGRLLKSDLNKAIINHNNTKQQLSDAEIQLLENKIYLLFLTEKTESETTDFTIDSDYFATDNLISKDTKFSLDNIPEVQQLNYQKQLSFLQQKSEKSKYLPIINLKGFLGANQYSNDFNPVKSNSWFTYSYIGLNVKMPLLLGEDKIRKLEQLELQSQQYGKQLEEKSAQYSQDSKTAELEIERIKIKLATQEKNLEIYKESLKISQDRLQGGQISALALNDQEQELQQLLAVYEITKEQIWLYRLNYLKASGQLQRLWK